LVEEVALAIVTRPTPYWQAGEPSCPTARTGSPPACSRSRATAAKAASEAS